MTFRPQPGMDVRTGNAMMIAQIMGAPPQPYHEGGAALRVLEVRGRTSGEPRVAPIGVPQREGVRYLVSPTRAREWVRNVLAAGECTLVTAATREQYRVRLASANEAVPVMQEYVQGMARRGAQFAVAQFPFAPDASTDEMRVQLDAVAVFRLDPLPSVSRGV